MKRRTATDISMTGFTLKKTYSKHYTGPIKTKNANIEPIRRKTKAIQRLANARVDAQAVLEPVVLPRLLTCYMLFPAIRTGCMLLSVAGCTHFPALRARCIFSHVISNGHYRPFAAINEILLLLFWTRAVVSNYTT